MIQCELISKIWIIIRFSYHVIISINQQIIHIYYHTLLPILSHHPPIHTSLCSPINILFHFLSFLFTILLLYSFTLKYYHIKSIILSYQYYHSHIYNYKFCMQSQTPIVIDNGSAYIKSGLSTSDSPSIIPSLIATPLIPNQLLATKDFYFGEEALAKKGILKLSYPIERGIVKNWEFVIKIWENCF